MNRKALCKVIPLGTITDDLGTISLAIRNRILRLHSPLLVFVRDQNVYAVREDSASAASITLRDPTASSVVGMYTTKTHRTTIRDDLAEWRRSA